MKPFLRSLKNSLVLKVVLAGTVLSALAAPTMLFARPALFPGKEDVRGNAQEVNKQAASQGVTVEILAVVSDEGGTAVSYVIRGREAEGDTAIPFAPPVLKDSSGNIYRATRASHDLIDKRRGTIVFPPIPREPGKLSLTFESIRLIPTANRQNETPLQGPWVVDFDWLGAAGASNAAAGFPRTAPFGRGQVTVASIHQSVLGTVVRGTLNGFDPAAIQALGCPIKSLQAAATDSAATPSNCRLGIGEDYRGFEVTFPKTSGSYVLDFEVSFGKDSQGNDLPASSRPDDRAKSSLPVQLP
jgi:hypothetical protein